MCAFRDRAVPRAHVPFQADHRGGARGGRSRRVPQRRGPDNPRCDRRRRHRRCRVRHHVSGARPLPPPRVRCLSAACADGSASAWQFLAESVSDAMVNSAKAQGATGTAHIASTSQVGISSEGIAGARLPIPARSRRDRRAARACERRCDGSQRTAPCSGRTSPSIRARGRQPYDADDLDSDGCCDDRDVLRVQCGAHFAVASRTRRFSRYTAGATRHPRRARRLYAPPSCFDEFPPAALLL